MTRQNTREAFDVTGMTCAACSARVERAAGGVEGVPVCLECLLGGIAHPGVQHLDVSRALQQTLVLVLAAQVDGRSRPLGELAH